MKIKETLKNILLRKETLILVVGIWLMLQLFYISHYWGATPSYDGRAYLSFAQACIDVDSWYPAVHNIENSHLFAPGYVNLLILVHKIFGSFNYISIVNLFFNIALLASTYILAKKIFSEEIAKLSLILFCAIFTNYTVTMTVASDLPFVLAMMLGLVCVTYKKPYALLLAGMFIALGNWIRPVAIVFILTSLVYMFANKYRFYNYILFFLAILITTFLIAKPVKDRIGVYLYTTNASGHNIAHVTSGKASIFPDFTYRQDSYYADLVNKKYEQKLLQADKEVRDRAMQLILENPFDYLSAFPKKFIYLYSIDNWTIRAIAGKGLSDVLKAPNVDKRLVYLKILMQSSVYYFVMLLFACYLFKNLKMIFRKQNIFLLVPALGTAMLLLMVVVDRYHYPFMPVIIIYAASALFSFVQKKRSFLRNSSKT